MRLKIKTSRHSGVGEFRNPELPAGNQSGENLANMLHKTRTRNVPIAKVGNLKAAVHPKF